MINNISTLLDKLGLGYQKRAIHAQFSSPMLDSQVFIQRIDGDHQINQGLVCKLICLSNNPNIALKEFIGSRVAVDQVTDLGQLFRTTGIVVEASQGQNDGSLTVYKLKIQDATALWHKRRNSRVFMSKSVLDITQILFSEWQNKSPLFASSLTLDLNGLTKQYEIRPFTMQTSAETEYEFLTRLWRSEGINWLIDETQHVVLHNKDAIEPQKLCLIDANPQFKALNKKIIRFHRSDATEYTDTITHLTASRALQPSAVHIQRWQAQHLEQEDGAGAVLSSTEQSSHYDNATLSLEDAWHVSPAWTTDLKQDDGATPSNHAQVDALNQHLNQQHRLKSKYFTAHSTVRDVQVGYWFKLNGHPEISTHDEADQELLVLSKQFYNQNNLPKDIQKQAEELLIASHWQNKNIQQEEQRQGNTLTLVRRYIDVVPEYHPEQDKPVTHIQRAKVVGVEGESIHVDEWGRIKVRFLFSREEDNTHDGGAGSNNTDTDSAWIDILTPWAGDGYGARFLPRVGEIVVIDFFDGNIDRPFVTGRLHEAERHPTQFDQQGTLPDTKKLSGIRSQEVDGSGYNQLRFDDTPGQISAQVQSSHAATQLNLGNLSHPKEQATSEGRGEGFELRSDAYGAVRAGQGLLISTYKQQGAQGQHLDAEVARQQFQESQYNSQALSEIAKNQQTDSIETVEQLKAFADQLEKKIAKFNKALLVLSSPDGIGISSEQDIHLSANGQISQTAGSNINLSTQNNLIAHAKNKISLFAVQGGIKAVAAKNNVELQAQNGMLDVLAKQGIQIISTEDRIEISSPKEIVLTGGSSSIALNESGINCKTAGKMELKASQHVFLGGGKAKLVLPALPIVDLKPNDLVLEYLHSDGDPVKGATFNVLFEDGTRRKGKLDEKGRAVLKNVPQCKAVIEYGEDQRSQEYNPSSNEDWFKTLI